MNEYMKLAKEQANKGMRNLEGGPFGNRNITYKILC